MKLGYLCLVIAFLSVTLEEADARRKHRSIRHRARVDTVRQLPATDFGAIPRGYSRIASADGVFTSAQEPVPYSALNFSKEMEKAQSPFDAVIIRTVPVPSKAEKPIINVLDVIIFITGVTLLVLSGGFLGLLIAGKVLKNHRDHELQRSIDGNDLPGLR